MQIAASPAPTGVRRRRLVIIAACAAVAAVLIVVFAVPGMPGREAVAAVTKYRECWLTPADSSATDRAIGFGDSITEGNHYDPLNVGANNSYFDVLACDADGLFSYGGTEGVWHETAEQVLSRIDNVLDAEPAMVLIIAGTNDVQIGNEADAIAALTTMKDRLDDAGIRAVFGTVPPSTGWPQETIAYNALLLKWATSNGAELVDYWGPLAETDGTWKPGLTSDGIHPSPEGAAIMADSARTYLEAARP